MKRVPGKTRQRLAKMMQAAWPEHNGFALTWLPENLLPAEGRYRSDIRIDCCRWEAFAYHFRADGTSFPMVTVISYYTMTELLKYKALDIRGGEVFPVNHGVLTIQRKPEPVLPVVPNTERVMK